MNKILCWFGLHDWLGVWDLPFIGQECQRCLKREEGARIEFPPIDSDNYTKE